ncbi:Protein CBG02054 [Caenorhabditis briggsae]|uniref:Protein CBG02054 n=1 Tax=Caenorhabditis briggsae TaxID=6238 RepID=A8WRW4_CAEBR|nr:Protein CBG02054 [Caenorhabditis briggsae]CAP23222.2 Protein CBG02054 [Caenorhabditis briggsae]
MMQILASPDTRSQRAILIRQRKERLEAARRASLLGRTTADTLLSAPEAASSSDRGEHTNSRSPSTSYSSCIDDERKFSSPHRRRVVDVSDHKTCALLMTRMKEASRQLPSPNHLSKL